MTQVIQFLRIAIVAAVLSGSIAACGSTPAPSAGTSNRPAATAVVPTLTGTPMEQAQTTLINYFAALHSKQYTQAAALYGGSLEVLMSNNPRVPGNDWPQLFENACTVNGFHCLEIKRIVEADEVSPNEFKFLVEFKNEDGSLFTCCGTNETAQPTMTQWPYTVKLVDDRFLVQELPVYTP